MSDQTAPELKIPEDPQAGPSTDKLSGVPTELDSIVSKLRTPRQDLSAHPTWTPQTWVDSFQFVTIGATRYLDVYFDGAWRQIQVASTSGRGLLAVVISPGDNWTLGDGKAYLDFGPLFDGLKLTYVRIRATTAGGGGGTSAVSIYNETDAVDVLSTSVTIDSGELGSETAAAPAVIDTAHNEVNTNDRWSINVDGLSPTAPQGLDAILEFSPA